MQVLCTEQDEGVASMTLALGDDDHKFDVWVEDDTVHVEYQETLSYRGTVSSEEPDEDIFRYLMTSDEMDSFMQEHGANSVKRERNA